MAAFLLAGDVEGSEPPSGAIELSLLSYNIRGLPGWITRDDAAARNRRIGARLDRYDVVLLQEDYAHHGRILEGVTHPVVERGPGRRSPLAFLLGWACGSCDSGLTLLVGLPPGRLIEHAKQSFERCAGWFSGKNDCWVSKGFLRARLEVAPGLEIDVYNLHLDAGMRQADRDARRSQLDEIRVHAGEHSIGRAVVVAGDFNLRPNDDEDREILAGFVEALALEERPLSSGPASSRWPGVDRVFHRSGDGVRIEALEISFAEEFAWNGAPLSNHPAILARFRVERR